MRKFSVFIIAMMAVIAFSSCNREIGLNVNEISLHVDETFKLITEIDDLSFVSENDFYATASSEGLITANKVGKTNIVVSNSKKTDTVQVDVTPRITLYDEPFLKFGASPAEMEAVEGSPDFSLLGVYTYTQYGQSTSLSYTFVDDSLTSVDVILPQNLDTELYLIERYTFIMSDAVSKYFRSYISDNGEGFNVKYTTMFNSTYVTYTKFEE